MLEMDNSKTSTSTTTTKCVECDGAIDMSGKYVIIGQNNVASWLHWDCMCDKIIRFTEEMRNRED